MNSSAVTIFLARIVEISAQQRPPPLTMSWRHSQTSEQATEQRCGYLLLCFKARPVRFSWLSLAIVLPFLSLSNVLPLSIVLPVRFSWVYPLRLPFFLSLLHFKARLVQFQCSEESSQRQRLEVWQHHQHLWRELNDEAFDSVMEDDEDFFGQGSRNIRATKAPSPDDVLTAKRPVPVGYSWDWPTVEQPHEFLGCWRSGSITNTYDGSWTMKRSTRLWKMMKIFLARVVEIYAKQRPPPLTMSWRQKGQSQWNIHEIDPPWSNLMNFSAVHLFFYFQ